jgi:small-conductance mechanosensitive channel/CRP-like cAMP-binding protein
MATLIARTWSRFTLLLVSVILISVSPAIVGWLGLRPGSMPEVIVRGAFEMLAIVAGALLVIRLLHTAVWNGVMARRTGHAPPRLLTDLVDGAILAATVIMVIAIVFNMPVNGLIATSGVAVAVIGFALKSMISDIFSGIAITLERPFRIGDWIEIQDGPVGQVRNMSWRATGLDLENGIHLVVPNSQLSEMVLKIYDRPERRWRDEIDVTLGFDVTAQQAERVLISAAVEVTEVAATGRSDTRIVGFDERGVVWRLRYWVPDYPSRGQIRNAVQRNLLRNLRFSGIVVPVPRLYAETPVHTPKTREEATAAFIRRVPLFEMLTATELDALAVAAHDRLVAAGGMVVHAGEDGSSLFLIKEGLMEVRIDRGNGEETMVARLEPGQFFGEMSLLTGAPRAATVRAVTESTVIEVTKDALGPILTERAELLETMSAVLADRQMRNSKAGDATSAPADAGEEQQTLAHQILGRMRTFFRIGASVA